MLIKYRLKVMYFKINFACFLLNVVTKKFSIASTVYICGSHYLFTGLECSKERVRLEFLFLRKSVSVNTGLSLLPVSVSIGSEHVQRK